MSPTQDNQYDINRIIVKPLYFGMAINVLIPMGLLLVCYYLDRQQSWFNRVGDTANTIFYLLGAISIAQAGVALWWRNKLMHQPMIRRKETFEDDLIEFLTTKSKNIFVIISGISLYGILYFYLTARFEETMFFVIFSFLVFQVVRPRYGFIRRLIAQQTELMEKGQVR